MAALTILVAAVVPLSADTTDRKLTFAMAKRAVEGGEDRLGVELLGKLVGEAESEAERLLYRALIERIDRPNRAFQTGVEEALAKLKNEAESPNAVSPSWVESEVLALAAALRLDRLKQQRQNQLDAVLQKHYAALGGLDHLTSLESYVAVGTASIADRVLPFRLVRSQPGLYRLDLATPVGLRIEAADTQAAWRADPTIDGGKPSYVFDNEEAGLRRGAHMFGPLIRYQANSEGLSYKGVESVDGHDHHAIELAGTGGAREWIYLDAETDLETKRILLSTNGKGVTEVATEFRAVDGYLLPHRQTVRQPGTEIVYEFKTYRLNGEVDLSLFDIESALPHSLLEVSR